MTAGGGAGGGCPTLSAGRTPVVLQGRCPCNLHLFNGLTGKGSPAKGIFLSGWRCRTTCGTLLADSGSKHLASRDSPPFKAAV